ncbi:MAG TPA: glutamate formimidoyltransferase [Bryobacterales bacterium]|nr:glutamate formimidoyltransferase [Bryobacterales bacterium]
MTRLVECVPNFSEGRDPALVEEIVSAIRSVEGVAVLDREMDADHNRSVITFAGPPEAVVEAAVRAVERAAARIDLNHHRGAHPRIGAADVVPFVPLAGVTLAECVELARRAGEEIWRRCRVPVYYYEAAARVPERASLENIRRGQFEGLREEVKVNPARRPDVGGPELNPTAGATVVGARKFLIAYNIYLATADVGVAKRIAKKIRTSSGGLPCVKAMGVEARGRAQVSMNLTDFEETPPHAVFEAVQREAAAEKTSIASSQIIGLIPKRALEMAAAFYLQVENFEPRLLLENRLAEALAASPGPGGLAEFLDQVAAPTPVPGGGSAAAAAAALAASLGAMVAGLASKKKDAPSDLAPLLAEFESRRRFFEQAVWRDAAAYQAVCAARHDPVAREAALQAAAAVPLEVAEAAASLRPPLRRLRALAPAAMHSDLAVAEALLNAALAGARANVEVNLAGIQDATFRSHVQQRLASLRNIPARSDATG